jgi:2Fe-2S ferredoxin
MPVVRFQREGEEMGTIDIPVGTSVMQGATAAGIDGIIGECGGELMCATCHVYVLSGAECLPPKSEFEDEMLDLTAEVRQSNSRLSCQIKMTGELDGLVVALPKVQV